MSDICVSARLCACVFQMWKSTVKKVSTFSQTGKLNRRERRTCVNCFPPGNCLIAFVARQRFFFCSFVCSLAVRIHSKGVNGNALRASSFPIATVFTFSGSLSFSLFRSMYQSEVNRDKTKFTRLCQRKIWRRGIKKYCEIISKFFFTPFCSRSILM